MIDIGATVCVPLITTVLEKTAELSVILEASNLYVPTSKLPEPELLPEGGAMVNIKLLDPSLTVA